MLPLVQMHQMVQPPLDFLGPHQGHLKPDYSPHHHGSHLSQSPQPLQNADSTPRAFAIRSAQHVPALHRITTTFTRLHAHDQAEHSLRRKTPNGTIDNGGPQTIEPVCWWDAATTPTKSVGVPRADNREEV
ncbi:hypothetical protein NEMBOFW57_005143 [Staphylotrichum longicolle]|uniref:Uncharacterized protein n=1 Tax=Staphylotrichum longicolle TaxID=669026 RepID=A0AAD4EX51_9PEZI|nr:hypothetical protein NEMBOFW57_005143 [Staphylotrichum longicolle]